VHDIFQLEPESRAILEDEDALKFEDRDSNTFAIDDSAGYNAETENFINNIKKSMNLKSIALEGDQEIYDLDRLSVRKQSVMEPEMKAHSCNLKVINHILSGFKTRFNDEYLEEFEIYSEQNEDIKITMIENSSAKSRFLFV
jgi:hypothetical protein